MAGLISPRPRAGGSQIVDNVFRGYIRTAKRAFEKPDTKRANSVSRQPGKPDELS